MIKVHFQPTCVPRGNLLLCHLCCNPSISLHWGKEVFHPWVNFHRKISGYDIDWIFYEWFVDLDRKKYFNRYQVFCLPETRWFAFKMQSQSLLNPCIIYTILNFIPMLKHLFTHNILKPLDNGISMREEGEKSIISPCVMSLIMRKLSSHTLTNQEKLVYYLKWAGTTLRKETTCFRCFTVIVWISAEFTIREHGGMLENDSAASVHIGNMLCPFSLWYQLTSGNYLLIS